MFLTHSLILIRPPHGISEALCIVQGKEGDNALWRLLSTNHFICFIFKEVGLNHSFNLVKLCYVLVPEPIITIKQVDFRPNCTGK